MSKHTDAFHALKNAICQYYPIGNDTWQALEEICTFREVKKGEFLYSIGKIPTSFAYVYTGLIRCFVCAENGQEYNKVFFEKDKFPGSMPALLTNSPSILGFEAIENSCVIEIAFKEYRQLLAEDGDLKMFQIHYLEKNWLLAKDAREIQIVQDDATARYLRFMAQHPNLVSRIPQYHVASHIGVTPTQLSRIRKKL